MADENFRTCIYFLVKDMAQFINSYYFRDNYYYIPINYGSLEHQIKLGYHHLYLLICPNK